MRRNAIGIVLLFASALPLLGQLAPEPDAPPAEGTSAVSRQQRQLPSAPPVATFQASANLVNLYFVARNKHGALVPDLTRDDCAIYEDNVLQTVQSFAARSDRPLTLGILLDTSRSQQRVLPMEQQAGDAFLKRVLRPGDEAFLMSFDVDVDLLADLTSNPAELRRAMDKAQINSSSGNFSVGTVPSIGKPKGTLLYDAVYLASQDKLAQESGRKALLLLTDGQDEGSQKRLQDAIESAQKADAVLYVLLIADKGVLGMFDLSGVGAMRKLADATGGQVFSIGSDGKKMQGAFSEIESELRTQYRASYTPTNNKMDGAYRSIRVACTQHGQPLRVQARQGYYAIPHTATGR
jgi:VWFA-related protein